MAFPEEINKLLMEYDQKKGLLRRLFGDQSGIRALRKLPHTDQNNFFRLYGCFNKNNRPKQNQASYQVYKAVLKCFLEHLGLTLTSNEQAPVYPKNLEYLDLAFITAKQTLTSENNLFVGLLHWDTFNRQTLLISERNALIKAAVQRLIKQAKGKQCVLVAPEYFYSRPLANFFESGEKDVNYEEEFLAYIPHKYHEEYRINKRYYPGSIRQIEEDQYEEIMSLLKRLSSQHPNLLLFPGTIAYRKPIEKKDLARLKKRIEENFSNIGGSNLEPIDRVNDGNVGSHFNPKRSNEQKNKFLAEFKYYAVNTAPCFYQGEQIFSQDKVYNFCEILEGYEKKIGQRRIRVNYPETIFLPGKYEGKTEKIYELSFALDICSDHGFKFLKKSLQENQEQPLLHICESASTPGKLKSQCQAIGGYFLHASSKLEYTSVIKREQEFVYKKEVSYQKEEICIPNKVYKGKSTLSFFKLPMPIANKEAVKLYSERSMSI